MIVSRIPSRGRATVPAEVYEALALRPGDMLSYAIEGDKVILARQAADDDLHGSEMISDEAVAPIIDQALAEGGKTFSTEEVFGAIRDSLSQRRGSTDAA